MFFFLLLLLFHHFPPTKSSEMPEIKIVNSNPLFVSKCALNVEGSDVNNKTSCVKCPWKIYDAAKNKGIIADIGFKEDGDGGCISCNPLCQQCLKDSNDCPALCSCLFCEKTGKCLVSEHPDGGISPTEYKQKCEGGKKNVVTDSSVQTTKSSVDTCDVSSILYSCLRGYYKENIGDNACIKCPVDCTRCSKEGDKVNCLHCGIGTFRYFNKMTNEYECVPNCPQGTGPRLLNHRECVKCSPGCEICDALAVRCRKCNGLYMRKLTISSEGDRTISSIVQCEEECPEYGYYQDGEWCLECSESCVECVSYNKCTECKVGYSLYEENGNMKCMNPSGPQITCDWRCWNCLGPESEQFCRGCRYYRLYTGSRQRCLYKCPPGFISDSHRYCIPNIDIPVEVEPFLLIAHPGRVKWISLSIGIATFIFGMIAFIVGILVTRPEPTSSDTTHGSIQ